MTSTDYMDLYLTQFFTTLGQLSAVVASTTVVVPMWNFYNMSHSSMWLSLKEKILTNWDYLWYEEPGTYDEQYKEHEN